MSRFQNIRPSSHSPHFSGQRVSRRHHLANWIGVPMVLLTFCYVMLGAPQQSLGQRFITLEVYSERSAEMTTVQQWLETLKQSGADVVRIKSVERPPLPNIDEFGEGKNASIKVTGYLDGRRLRLPNRAFTLRQSAEISAYLKALKDDGADVAMSDKKAFGLTSKQLVEVHTQLSAKIPESTKGREVAKVLPTLLALQRMNVVVAPIAQRTIQGEHVINEELKGLSIGTGIAAIIRPLGLVMTMKRKPGREIELHLTAFDQTEENWPIGWPKEQSGSMVAPKLFDRIDLEIRGIELKRVLDALEKRVGVPFLYDHNDIARKGIDLDGTKVTFVQKRAVQILAINKMLNQVRPRLKQEIRLDENEKPFLWISPLNSR